MSVQPIDGDLVLGGDAQASQSSAVLGGIVGLRQRLQSPWLSQQVAAVADTRHYGAEGLTLAVQCLQNSAREVRWAAYQRLRHSPEPLARSTIARCNRYQFFTPQVQLSGHLRPIAAIALSRDGHTLATAGRDGQILVWQGFSESEISQPARQFFLPARQQAASIYHLALALSPDGQMLCACNENDLHIYVWDLRHGELRYTLSPYSNGTPGKAGCLAISADGTRLASTGWDYTGAKIWNLETGQLLDTQPGCYSVLTFSPDSRYLILAGENRLDVWDYGDRRLSDTWKYNGGWLEQLIITQDGQTLIGRYTSARGSRITLWDRITRTAIDHPAQAHWNVTAIALSQDQQVLFTGHWDQPLQAWELHSGQPIYSLVGRSDQVLALAINPATNSVITSGSQEIGLYFWNPATQMLSQRLSSPADEGLLLALSQDGQTLVTAGQRGTIKIWATITGQEQFTLAGHRPYARPVFAHSVHDGPVLAIALSATPESLLLSASRDRTLRIWDLSTRQSLASLSPQGNPVAVAWHPAGDRFASGGDTLQFWQWPVGQVAWMKELWRDPLTALTFSPDGTILISGHQSGTVRFWETAGGQLLEGITAHHKPIGQLVVDHVGQTLASSSTDGILQVRHWPSSQLRYQWATGIAGRLALALSPDGRTLFSTGANHSLAIYDLLTGEALAPLVGHTSPILAIAIAAQGDRVVSSDRHQVLIWQFPGEADTLP